MGRIHNFNFLENSLVILNEDELEEGKLYFTTLDHHQIPLFKEIPGMTKISGRNNSEHMIIDYETGVYDINSENNINLKEPFMVLQKEKRHAKYTCIQLLQGELILWIVQKYPNLTRKDCDGYFSALECPETNDVNRVLKEISKKRYQTGSIDSRPVEQQAADYIKSFLKEKIAVEKQKAKNAPMFKALKEKYAKKP